MPEGEFAGQKLAYCWGHLCVLQCLRERTEAFSRSGCLAAIRLLDHLRLLCLCNCEYTFHCVFDRFFIVLDK